jgi:hypothetical protein
MKMLAHDILEIRGKSTGRDGEKQGHLVECLPLFAEDSLTLQRLFLREELVSLVNVVRVKSEAAFPVWA